MDQEDSLAVEYPKNIHEDMVHSSGLRGYLEVMQQLGTDPMPLLAKHGIQLAQLQDDNVWISHTALIQLLEESAQQANCADLGLRISQYQDIGILGVLGLILQSASTLREVIKYSSDLLFLHGSALRLYINDRVSTDVFESNSDIVELIFDIQLHDATHILSKRQTMDMGLAVCHRVLRYLSSGRYQPLRVALPHSPIAPLNVYKRFFHAEVMIDQQHAALYFHKDMLNITLDSIDHGLREIVDSYLERSFGVIKVHLAIVFDMRYAFIYRVQRPIKQILQICLRCILEAYNVNWMKRAPALSRSEINSDNSCCCNI